MIAPHPYFTVRGTPIDLDLVLRALSDQGDIEVDAVVYGEGEDRTYPNVRIVRAPNLSVLQGSAPGFSGKKLLWDVLLTLRVLLLCATKRYDLVHAGEEAVFIAILIQKLWGTPYAYDIDSSIAQQLVEARPALAPISGWLDRLEARAMRGAVMCFPVCRALADLCAARGATRVKTLHDISQLDRGSLTSTGALRHRIGDDAPIVLYVGNLEAYQGVDLLLEGFALAVKEVPLHLVVVGGDAQGRRSGAARSHALGIEASTHWLPPEPLERLGALVSEATILAAPRLRGINTPMKIFPFLHSGKPVLLTRLPTHTQIINDQIACLVEPDAPSLAEGLLRLVRDPALCATLGAAGVAFVEANHTYAAHRERLHAAYASIAEGLAENSKLEASC